MTTAAKPQQRKSKNDNKVWEILCSVRLAVIIIIIMAVSCVLGTIILQQKSPEEYINRYGAGLAKFYSAIQFTDIFRYISFLLVFVPPDTAMCKFRLLYC